MSLTNDDLQKIDRLIKSNVRASNNSLATKADLQKTFVLIPVAIDTQLDIKLEKYFDEADVKFTKKFGKVMNSLDKIAGSLKTINEQVSILGGNKDQIENHEERLVKIETKLDLSM